LAIFLIQKKKSNLEKKTLFLIFKFKKNKLISLCSDFIIYLFIYLCFLENSLFCELENSKKKGRKKHCSLTRAPK